MLKNWTYGDTSKIQRNSINNDLFEVKQVLPFSPFFIKKALLQTNWKLKTGMKKWNEVKNKESGRGKPTSCG